MKAYSLQNIDYIVTCIFWVVLCFNLFRHWAHHRNWAHFFFDLAISGKVLSFSLIICSAIRTKVHLNQSDDCFVTKIAFHENELILKIGKWIRNFPYYIFFLKQKNFVERKTPKLTQLHLVIMHIHVYIHIKFRIIARLHAIHSWRL